ncbi:MAG: hypothetical protein Ct9H300mP6_06140 [Gammaproteobacteria bacterium]|nr:MAG: hypothetical protein Ct9H300mP6_06140 [Gammaproteobacteria bacterium]
MIGSILLFFVPTQHNHLHPSYYFIAEGLAIIAVMILISFAIWLMMMIFKKLMALIAAITLHELKTEFLTVYALSSCLMAIVQYVIN